ncbi:MAG: YiiX/YebB-like N1pC/P60 family cysteine hydrolase [Chitinophagaceae bacterium]
MIRKIAITLLILHGFYIGISNSLIKDYTSETRILQKSDPLKAIAETKNLLQEGDMVFRLNMDGYSQFIKIFSRQDKQFSHAGIVIMEDKNPVVYHMINGDESRESKIIKSSFEEFINPKKNYAFGIYRNGLTQKEKQALVSLVTQWYAKGVTFDFNFDLVTNDKMYCSEMIAKAITKATNKRIEISTTKLTSKEAIVFAAYSKLPLDYTKNLQVVAIDNLYQHKWCNVVKEYRFY